MCTCVFYLYKIAHWVMMHKVPYPEECYRKYNMRAFQVQTSHLNEQAIKFRHCPIIDSDFETDS